MHNKQLWNSIFSPPADAQANMALDKRLYEQFEAGQIGSTLRIYTWDRSCVTYGYSQNPIEELSGYGPNSVARRMTGGGIVYHQPGDLTYCLVTDRDNPLLPRGIEASCGLVHMAVADMLAEVGISATFIKCEIDSCLRRNDKKAVRQKFEKICFQTPARYELVTTAGKKIAGSAQKRGSRTLMQQGTVPVVPGVVNDKATGIMTETGQMYAYDYLGKLFAQKLAGRLGINYADSSFSSSSDISSAFLRVMV